MLNTFSKLINELISFNRCRKDNIHRFVQRTQFYSYFGILSSEAKASVLRKMKNTPGIKTSMFTSKQMRGWSRQPVFSGVTESSSQRLRVKTTSLSSATIWQHKLPMSLRRLYLQLGASLVWYPQCHWSLAASRCRVWRTHQDTLHSKVL